jgi:DNA replication protein DnaC
MIAKRVPMPEGGGRGFVGLQEYIEQAHKASHIFSQNITTLDTAAEQMKAVAKMNRRTQDPLYHLILSWPEFEKPTPEQVEEAVQAQIKALGFDGHQYIAAIHTDTPDIHVHVMINRVHPETFRAHHPKGDFFTLDRTCREIELKQGWTHDRGPNVVEYVGEEAFVIEAKDRHLLRGLSDGAKALQKWSGEEPLEQFLRDNTFLEDRLIKATSWQQVHDAFRLSGLEIKQHGEGLVVEHLATGTHAKASYAFSHADLTNRFHEAFTVDIRASEREIEAILSELTRMDAVFSERDLDAYLVAYVEEDRRETLKERVMAAGQTVHLEAENLDADKPEKTEPRLLARFTTAAVLAEETAALDAAAALKGRLPAQIDPEAIQKAITCRTMRADQLDAFQQGMAAQGIGIVQGRAGTGKSYMMTAWMEAHRDSGYRVVGLAPTNIVAQAMEADGFAEGRTVDAVLHAAKKGKLDWDAKTVLILDEAGMVSNNRMRDLLSLAAERGAKVLMVGDDRQLPAVERGGLFA